MKSFLFLKKTKTEINAIFKKISKPFEDLKEHEKKTMLLYIEGKQSFGSTMYQLCGNTLGKTFDFIGLALGGAIIQRIGEKIGVNKKMQKVFTKLFGKKLTQKALVAMSLGKKGWSAFQKKHPETARNIEASIGPAEFTLLMSGIKISPHKIANQQLAQTVEFNTSSMIKKNAGTLIKEKEKE